MLVLSAFILGAEEAQMPQVHPETLEKVARILQDSESLEEEKRTAAWQSLRDMSNLALPALVVFGQRENLNEPQKRTLARALGVIRDPRAVPLLLKLLADKEHLVVVNAARALGEAAAKGDRKVIAALRELLTDKRPDVPLRAAYALAELGDQEVFQSFVGMLEAEDDTVRSRAVYALGKYGGKPYVEKIARALDDKSRDVREEALEALVQIGRKWPRTVVPGLVKALDDRYHRISKRAMDMLEKHTQQKFGHDPTQWKKWYQENKDRYGAEAEQKPQSEDQPPSGSR